MENQSLNVVKSVEGRSLKIKEKIHEINKMIEYLSASDQDKDLEMNLNEFHEKLSKMVAKYSDNPINVKIGSYYKND